MAAAPLFYPTTVSSASSSSIPLRTENGRDKFNYNAQIEMLWGELQQTWRDFNRALRSVEPFDQWHWMYALSKGFLRYVYYRGRLYRYSMIWRIVLPGAVLVLFAFVFSCYFFSLRRAVIQERWCQQATNDHCGWDWFHTGLIIYLFSMTFYYYWRTIFDSPGVALPENEGYASGTTPSSSENKRIRWTAWESRGGCCCIDPVLDMVAERNLVNLYESSRRPANRVKKADSCQQAKEQTRDNKDNDDSFPFSIHPTYCSKCCIIRPPRCHHCSVCNRCVLQMDHHCPWVNNCIGYNNLRTFCLAILFLDLSCWYGVFTLAKPFSEIMGEHIRQNGWKLFYSQGTGILDLPMPWVICYQFVAGTAEDVMVIKIIFSLLVAVGATLLSFLYMFGIYIVTGRTGLEHRVILRQMTDEMAASGRQARTRINPFHQGWRRNLKDILGDNIWFVFVPIPVRPVPPYIPEIKSKQK